MPRSSALCMTLREPSRSIRSPPKLLQPSPTTETLRPDLPRLRCCIACAFLYGEYAHRQKRSQEPVFATEFTEFTEKDSWNAHGTPSVFSVISVAKFVL